MANKLRVGYTATFMAVPLLFCFAALEDDVEVVAVSTSEVVVVADDAAVVSEAVSTEDVTLDLAGFGDCSPTANSTGFPAYLSHVGGAQFHCVQMPAGNWSQLVAASSAVAMYPFLGGNLCLNPLQMVKASAPTMTGAATSYLMNELGMPATTWHFQVMYRDPGFGAGANLSGMCTIASLPSN